MWVAAVTAAAVVGVAAVAGAVIAGGGGGAAGMQVVGVDPLAGRGLSVRAQRLRHCACVA